jgi:hypothetical protein
MASFTELPRFELDIRGGNIVTKATIIIHAKDYEIANKIAEEIVSKIDGTAYLNSLHRMA